MKRSELVQQVINWDRRFPFDKWWRMKYNVAFMSSAHRESSFLFQLIEFEEDKLFNKELNGLKNKLHKEGEEEEGKYIPNIGDFLKSPTTITDFLSEAKKEMEMYQQIAKED